MQAYYDVVVNSGGTPVNGASVFVYDAAGALATIYQSTAPIVETVLTSNGTPYYLSQDLVTPQVNPITTGADGRYIFFAENGVYTVVITANGYNSQTFSVSLYDTTTRPSPTYDVVVTPPNDAVNVSAIGANVGTTDGDLALYPKGAGALLGQIPTATVAGGDKRGQYAVDWQLTRQFAVEVASGLKSVIGGGHSNKASNDYAAVGGGTTNYATGYISTVAGGLGNISSGSYGAIGGGAGNIASSDASTVAGGDSNQSTGIASTVSGGSQNDATNSYASVIGGRQNAATGPYSIAGGYGNVASGDWSTAIGGDGNTSSSAYDAVIGGANNIANGGYSAVLGGTYGTTRGIVGYIVSAASYRPIQAKAGVSQTGMLVLGVQTTGNTATKLKSSFLTAGADNQLILADNSAVLVNINMIAWDQTSWFTVTRQGVLTRGASAATVVYTDVGSSTSSRSLDGGAATWAISQAADTTNGGLAVTVTGQAGKTIRWVCRLETTEVSY